ncbi:hypothetical protein [Pseudomonas fluorescens]|uniref:hypothetical protein n=1 Tax=Pseudomonas fluorescens TaxID=294 RepID=UPI0003600D02|nr:hypothetical protein [Pseudomonas fluorescens]
MRPIITRSFICMGLLLSLATVVFGVGVYRFGSDPRLAFVLLENCEAAVLRLVKTPSAMTLLNARIYTGGNGRRWRLITSTPNAAMRNC